MDFFESQTQYPVTAGIFGGIHKDIKMHVSQNFGQDWQNSNLDTGQ